MNLLKKNPLFGLPENPKSRQASSRRASWAQRAQTLVTDSLGLVGLLILFNLTDVVQARLSTSASELDRFHSKNYIDNGEFSRTATKPKVSSQKLNR
jgi:hypothetical protein